MPKKSSTIYHINVTNWDKFQGAGKTVDWFKFDHNFFEDPLIFELTMREKLTFIYILTRCSLKRSSSISLMGSIISSWIPHKGVMVDSTLSKLSKSGLIVLQIRRDKIRGEDIKDPPPSPKKSPPSSGPNFNDLAQIWNEECPNLPQAMVANKSRMAAARSRLDAQPDLEFWREFARAINSNPFCCGDNDRKWKASVDYFVSPQAWVKFMEKTGMWTNYERKRTAEDFPPEDRSWLED